MRQYSHNTINPDTFLGFQFTDCHFSSVEYFVLNLEQKDLVMFSIRGDFLMNLEELGLNPELKWHHGYWDEKKQEVVESGWDH
ncbi:MAG: hypothetical protein H3C47_15900 [Candidatus Cloacimonetes bacterium]|nr:hypothetical protein [Candidatus Cloacimonadota bacterium]